MRFWLVWGIDAVVAMVAVYFFLIGVGDGSVSSFNAGLWFALLAGLGGILGGGLVLRDRGHPGAAIALLAVLAIPAVLGVLFFLVVLVSQPRWN